MSALRPYQHEAIGAICTALDGARSTLAVLPTGTGKTVVFAQVAQHFRSRGRILVIAHREELIRQAVEKFQAWTPLKCEIEMAEARAQIDGLYPPDVVVASVQSISRKKRLGRFTPFDFDVIIIDEAHHATASTYRNVLDYFDCARVLGVTATPDRGDKEALGQVFESVAYTYEIRQAIQDGYLVDVKQKAVDVQGLDLSKVRTTRGDLNEGDLDKLLREEGHLHHVAEPVVELARDRKTLIFAVTVAHAHDLARVISGYGVPAEALDGSADADKRKDTLDRYRRGEISVLVNCALFTEGFDLPAISCVAVARPTKSRALYTQMVGRGTRLSPETGKEDLLVLDFRGNAGKHSICSPIDILGGTITPRVHDEAEKILEKEPAKSLSEAVDEAEREIARREAEEIEREKRRRAIRVETRKQVRDVDPFRVLGAATPEARGGGRPNDFQLQTLNSLGFPATSKGWEMDTSQAGELIEQLTERQRKGLCSFKQARLLRSYGLDGDVSKREASRMIGRIAENKWRVPADLVREP